MSNVGFDTFFSEQVNTIFIVKNITIGTKQEKTVRLFQYPIPPGQSRNLMSIPSVSEADLRHALLKGDIMLKLRNREIEIVDSNIDLLQFDSQQKAFLQSVGVVNGLSVGSSQLDVLHKEDIVLIGIVDDINTIYTVLPGDKFIQNSTYKIIVYKNGVKLLLSNDYFIAESGGPETGYDTIILVVPPTTVPAPIDVITADYYVVNI